VNGYNIPKDTMIMINMFGGTRDEKIWPNPEEFNPERFLPENAPTDPTEKLLRKMGSIPFSCGSRVCLGQHLARLEIFLFAAHLFQQYTIEGDATVDEVLTMGLSPKDDVCPILKHRI
jgi:cytochrome P450